MNFAKPDMPFSIPLDVISLNYQGTGVRDLPSQYQPYHDKYPQKMILSSESAAAVSSRGVYLFPVTQDVRTPVRDGIGGDPKNHQVSSYDLYSADFGSSPDRVFASQDKNPYSAGEFIWSGWDYRRTIALLFFAKLLFWSYRLGRVQEGPLLPVSG